MAEAKNGGIPKSEHGPGHRSAPFDQGDNASEPRPWSRRYETYVILVLMVVQTLNFLDRSIINILSEPIKLEFGLSDWELGILNGLAFAILYTTLAIPIARLAEKTNRSFVIAGSVGIWSLATMCAAFVQSFSQLVVTRIFVGIGEAGSTPAAHSLITEVVPRERRAIALSVFSAGIPIGSLIGIALGAGIADAVGWRWALLWAGAPGLVIALIVALTIWEPRKKLGAVQRKLDEAPPFRQAIREITASRVFWLMAIGSGIVGINNYARLTFLPSFYIRNYSEQFEQIALLFNGATGFDFGGLTLLGVILGVSYGIGGLLGVLAGGWLCDHVARTDVRGYATVPMWTSLLVIPFGVASQMVPDVLISIALSTLASFFSYGCSGPIFASVQSIMKVRNRATAAALLIFVINLFGLAIGTPLVGAISDLFASTGMSSGQGLAYALISAQILTLAGIFLFFLASLRMKQEFVG